MNEQIREAFDDIHASDALKEKTLHAVLEKNAVRKHFTFRPMHLVPVLGCLMLMLITSWRLYFTETLIISVDVNPSVELSVNRFDIVIAAVGVNEDGQNLLTSVRVEHQPYDDAVEALLTSDTVTALTEDEAVVEIGVIGNGDAQETKVRASLEHYCENTEQATCYTSDQHELEEAHAVGLSCGKYRVYQELIALGIDITPEEAQSMTMRQLRALKGESDVNEETECSEEEPQQMESCKQHEEYQNDHDNSHGEHHGGGHRD